VYYDAVNNQIPDLSDAQHRINSSQTDSSQPRPFQVDVLHQQSHWPPYYPPEAYSYLSHEDNATSDPGFRELTPEVVSHSPHEAPFNFSSSSLSAALSDPPRIPMSLPPTTECDPSASVELGYQDIHHQMSLDDLPVHLEEGQCHLSLILSRPCLGAEGGAQYNVSLFSPPIDTIRSMTNDGWDNFPADFLSLPVNEPFSLQVLDGLFTDPNLSDVSSTLSTPSHFPTSLSAVSSPNGDSPVELPGNDPRVVTSLLPADSRKQPPRTSSKKVPKKYVKPQGPARLSSMLALTPE
jgi:myb proto-oncogene protein/Myb-like DNA-binding protein BAS1